MGGSINEHVLPCLDGVISSLGLITVSSTRNIVGHCVLEAVNEIKGSCLVSAGRILNLIHNLPMDEESERVWDIDYFISAELPTFLEHFDEIKSARSIALYVCQELARQYLPDPDWRSDPR